MVKILVISAQGDLESYLSKDAIAPVELKIDYCSAPDSAMKKISETGGYHIVFSDKGYITQHNSMYLNQLIIQNPVTKIILLFDEPDLSEIRSFMNLGVYDFLLRPITAADLQATLNKVIRETQMLTDVLEQHDQLINIEQELEIARSIQRSLLNRAYPYFPEYGQIDICGHLVSSREVGGDFFDTFILDPDRLGIVIGDVSGKGLPAALEMARIKITLQALAVRSNTVDSCLTALNSDMFLDQQPQMPAAVFYGILNISTGSLSYCNTGIAGCYHLGSRRQIHLLNGNVQPQLGEFPDLVYRSDRIALQPGESLVLYSDGLVSSLGQEIGSTFSRLQTVNGSFGYSEARAAVEDIIRQADRLPPADDLTCLLMNFRGSHDASQ
jgi:sigma-B regulation protein RsbU (phosphoserine phosphatase)